MSRQTKLNSYKGRLSAKQTADGMNAAIMNARRLAKDARIMFENKSFPTATSLAILSIEESGKVSILRSLLLARNDSDLRQDWKEYRTHTYKNRIWILPDLVLGGRARSLDDFRVIFEDSSEHPYVIDQLKQLGLYTDCLGEAHWAIPAEVIDESTSDAIVRAAEFLVDKKEITERELELWIEHIGPVWKKDNSWMKQGLVNWYSAMQREGLIEAGENKMTEFVK